MSVLETVRDLFAGPDTSRRADDSDGAYWCHDCQERLLDLDVEGPEPPACPECGEEMEFERSVGTADCAC